MYDSISYLCYWCKKKNHAQTKVIGRNVLKSYKIGEEFPIDEKDDFYNCILNLKNKCEKCNKETAIVIKNGKFVGVENPKFSTIIEHHWGNYEIVDELEQIVKEKLKKIENDNKKS